MLHIEIITKIERNHALSLATDAINASEGFILNHQLFSNMGASIMIEMPAALVAAFMARLTDAGLRPSADAEVPDGVEGDMRGTIAFTFIHDEKDMKRDVPAFG